MFPAILFSTEDGTKTDRIRPVTLGKQIDVTSKWPCTGAAIMIRAQISHIISKTKYVISNLLCFIWENKCRRISKSRLLHQHKNCEDDHRLKMTKFYSGIQGSGSVSASSLPNSSSVKIRSMTPMTKTTPRKMQLQTNPNSLNKTLNTSETRTPKPFIP